MPKKRVQDLTRQEKEAFFIRIFAERGADQGKVSACEKRAHLKPGSGVKILRRKSTKAELERIRKPLETVERNQALITDTIEVAKRVYQEQLANTIEKIKLHKLDSEILRGRLMQGVIALDLNRQPAELLNYIKTAMVVDGLLESAQTKRVAPVEEGPERGQSLVYTALFYPDDAKSLPSKAASESAPNAQDDVFDLIPQPPAPPSPPEPPASNPNIITVDVG